MSELNYEQGLKKLQAALPPGDTPQRSDFYALEARLLKNRHDEHCFGPDQNTRTEFARIMDALGQLTQMLLDAHFIDLCLPSSLPEPAYFFPQATIPTEQVPSRSATWTDETEIILEGKTYLVEEPLPEVWTAGRSAVQRQAIGFQRPDGHKPWLKKVWLKQVQILHSTAKASALQHTLQKEAQLLEEIEQASRNDFPRLLASQHQDYETTIAYTFTQGSSLQQFFAVRARPLDSSSTLLLLRSMSSLCAMLTILHRRGLSHRALTPEAIILQEGRRALLRDVGLAAHKLEPGEGPTLYQAPEQRGMTVKGSIAGSHTDIYQLGVILYHLLTGHLPLSCPLPSTPPAQWSATFPSALYPALQRATLPEPKDRWRSMLDFSQALKQVTNSSK